MSDLDKAISATLDVEGVWSNHRADPGGKTKYGITHRTFLRADALGLVDSMSVEDLTVKEARRIYREMYWKQCGAHLLPSGVNALVFDIHVNTRPPRAALILQRSINWIGGNVKVDGHVGRRTADAAHALNPLDLINEISARRHRFWQGLRTWKVFGFGWTRRGCKAQTHAVVMNLK